MLSSDSSSSEILKPDFVLTDDTTFYEGKIITTVKSINDRVTFNATFNEKNKLSDRRSYWDMDGDGFWDYRTPKISHQFPEPGQYFIKYCYNNPNDSSRFCRTKMVIIELEDNDTTSLDSIKPPSPKIKVDFSVKSRTMQGSTLTLEDLTTPQSAVENRLWEVNGIRVGKDKRISYKFDTPGLINIYLWINDGNLRAKKMVNVVSNEKPKKIDYQAKISGPKSIQVGQIATFKSVSSPSNKIFETVWTVGPNTYNSNEIQLTFDKPGEHKLKLCINDKEDCSSIRLKVNQVEEEPQKPDIKIITSFPPTAFVGEEFELTDLSNPSAAINDRAWIIDGKTYNSKTVKTSIDKSGTYKIKFCVNNLEHCEEKEIRILESPGDDRIDNPSINISINHSGNLVVGESINFNHRSYPSNFTVTKYEWDIGGQKFNSADPNVVFSEPGYKRIELCLYNTNGDKNCTSKSIKIEGKETVKPSPEDPSVDFNLPNQMHIGDNIRLQSTNTHQLASKKIVWYINGREVSNNPSYLYSPNKTGTFEFTLEIDGKRISKKVKIEEKEDIPITTKPYPYPVPGEEIICSQFLTIGISSQNRCGTKVSEKEWSDACIVQFTPKVRCALTELRLFTNATGSVEIKISNGQEYAEHGEYTVNRGPSTIDLEDLYYCLEPNWTYYLTLTPIKGSGGKTPQFENSYKCGLNVANDQNLSIDYKNNFVIYDLKYCVE